MVPPNMLKRIMPTIPPTSKRLNRPIRGLCTESVRPVVAHADLITQFLLDFAVWHGIHVVGCFADQEAKHFALGRELDEGELDCLVGGEGFAEGAALAGVGYGLLDAVDCCSQ